VKFLLIATVLGLIAAASSAPAFAAQGQITEVNPSGIHGTIAVIEDGELTGETIHVISRPHNGRPARMTASDDMVEFDIFHNFAVLATKSPDVSLGAK